jgi:hypothetical protein
MKHIQTFEDFLNEGYNIEGEVMEIALHLYMVNNDIPVKITKHEPQKLYKKEFLPSAEKKIPDIEQMITKKGYTKDDIDHLVNGRYGGFEHALKVIFSK